MGPRGAPRRRARSRSTPSRERRRGGVQPVRQRDRADDRDDLAVPRLAGRDAPASRPRDRCRTCPTLVIDGAADIRTPLEDADAVTYADPVRAGARGPVHRPLGARERPRASEQCAARGVRQFFIGEPVTPCAASDNPFSPTPVAPTSFEPPAADRARRQDRPHDHRRAARPPQDMRRQVIGDALEAGRLPSRAGGLRGGRVGRAQRASSRCSTSSTCPASRSRAPCRSSRRHASG